MKRKIVTCDICEKDITDEDIRYKFKQYHNHYGNYDDFEFLKWTNLDMCYECHERFVKFVREMKGEKNHDDDRKAD